MNDDLISRRAAEMAFIEKGQRSRRYKWGEVWELNFEEIRDVLNDLSSAQPAQKTGRWVTQFDGTLHYCSECGWALMDTESGVPPYMGIDYHRSNEERWTCCPGWNEWLMNFCPNCGAKMESEG